jgi:tetratricopeptide (TPR) repeat protein
MRRILLLAATLLCSTTLLAQSAAEHIAMGDRDRVALNAAGALSHYEAALRAEPTSAEALWRASSEAIDLGEFNDAARDSLYRLGAAYARRAVEADAGSSMAHFALAKALGRRALSLGVRDRVKYAGAVRNSALESLKLDSLNAGSLHTMGVWHRHVVTLGGWSRFIAKNFLGGKVLEEANLDDAARFLERAAALEPERIVHRVELARVYRERREMANAREQYQLASRLKPAEYNDRSYQQAAERELRELR